LAAFRRLDHGALDSGVEFGRFNDTIVVAIRLFLGQCVDDANFVDRIVAQDFRRNGVCREGRLHRDRRREVSDHGRFELFSGQGAFEEIVFMKELMKLIERIFAVAAGEAHSDMACTFGG
jgi:hypothetical protein